MTLDASPFSGFLSPAASSVVAVLKWVERRRLALLNTLVVVFVVGPVVTPLLLAAGATSTATDLYRFFHLVCHQWAFRSFFFLGPHATFSRDQLIALGMDPYTFVGDAQMGWKMAFCERNLAIFVGLLAFGLPFGSVHRQMPPASFTQFAVLVSPMALDGLTQLVGWRESTWELRIATGVPFGIASGWFLYPRFLPGPNMWRRSPRLRTDRSRTYRWHPRP